MSKLNNNLRNLWDESIKYDDSDRSNEEQESIDHCRNSDHKYFIHYVSGNTAIFEQFINKDDAVR